MNRKHSATDGFALAEVLIASAILTLILGALMSTVSAGSAQLLKTKGIIDRQMAGLSIQGLLGNIDQCRKSIRQLRQIDGKSVVQEIPNFAIPPGGDITAALSPQYYGIDAILLNSQTPLLQNGKTFGHELIANMRIAPAQSGRKIEAVDPAQPAQIRKFVRFMHVLSAELCDPKTKGSCSIENRQAIPWRIAFSSVSEVISDPYENGSQRLYMLACGATESTDEALLGSIRLIPAQTLSKHTREVKVQFDHDPSRLSYDWVVPAGVKYVEIEAWGAGGSGGAGDWVEEKVGGGSGGGGGGGAYFRGTFAVLPGEMLRMSPGAGGAPLIEETVIARTCKSGNAGEDSKVQLVDGSSISTLLTVPGGEGGESGSAGFNSSPKHCAFGGEGGGKKSQALALTARLAGGAVSQNGMKGQGGSCSWGVVSGIGGGAPSGGMGALTYDSQPQIPGGASHGGTAQEKNRCSGSLAGAAGRIVVTYTQSE